MADSNRYTAVAIYYALLVMTGVALLADCYFAYTRVVRQLHPVSELQLRGATRSFNLTSWVSNFIVTTVGYTANAFVMISVVGSKKMRASPVNMLLFNLAISDFTYITCNDRIGIHDWPPWMHERLWSFPSWMCPVNRYVSSAAFMASIGTFVAIAIERYVVTVRPFQARVLCSRSKLFYWVLAIWIFAFVFELPNYVTYDTYDAVVYYKERFNVTLYVEDRNGIVLFTVDEGRTQLCTNPSKDGTLWKIFKWVEFCSSYVFPIAVAVALYPRTCRAVWAVDPGFKGKSVKVVTGSKVSNDESRPRGSDKNRRQVVKMLIVCVVVFFVCYTPLVVIFVRSNLFPMGRYRYETEFILVAGDLVAYVCAFNPFIYTLFSTAFRHRVKEILTCQQTIDVFLALLFLVGFYVTLKSRV